MTAHRQDLTAPRVVLHVGAPKSGTTFLQNALWRNHEQLQEAGFTCPGQSQRDMFLAAIEVRDKARAWGLEPQEVAGRWERVCAEALASPSTTILSHELLAAADDQQVEAALAHLAGADLHLVFTARDLGRQVVSEWQERVKNGSTHTFREFQRSVTRGAARGSTGGFWAFQDLPAVLARWGAGLDPDHVHVVVAPPQGSPPDVLWRRFGEAVGFRAELYDPVAPEARANRSLGVTQIAVLRQVNQALDGRIVQPSYARVVKRFFAQGLLATYDSPRPECPARLARRLNEVARGWMQTVAEAGYQVHGELDELLSAVPDPAGATPDAVDAREQADISAAVIADLLVEVMRLRRRLGSSSPADVPREGWLTRVHRRLRPPGRSGSGG